MTQIVNQLAEWTNPRGIQTPHAQRPEPHPPHHQTMTAQPSRPGQAAGHASASPYSDLSRRPINPMAQAGGSPATAQAFAHPAAHGATDQTSAEINAQLNGVAPRPPVAVPNAVSSLGFPFQASPAQKPFPAAPSKVLQEQFAKGGTGHIPTVCDPAFEPKRQATSPVQEQPVRPSMAAHAPGKGALLEGVFPYPPAGAPGQHPSASQDEPSISADQASSRAPVLPSQTQGHQMLPSALETRMADWIEPSMAETNPEGDAARAAEDDAPWRAQGAWSGRRPGRATWVLPSVLLALITLVAGAAYTQLWRASSAPELLRVVAPTGPERVLPEDPGGRQVAGRGLVILHPEQDSVIDEDAWDFLNQDLSPGASFSSVLAEAIEPQEPDTTQVSIIEEFDIPIRLEGALLGKDQTGLPAAALASSPQPLSLQPTTTAQASVAEATRPAAPLVSQAPSSDDEVARPSATTPVVDQRPGPALLAAAPTGLYVQEGSYGSLTRAQEAYANLLQEAPAQIATLEPLYHQVEVNGQIWVRLYLTGFESGAAARQVGGRLGRRQNQWLVFNG